jgi:hypothetical protein
VVAGPGADHQERQIVLRGDPRHQRLGSIAPGHAEQVAALGHRLTGQGRDIHDFRAVEHGHLRA